MIGVGDEPVVEFGVFRSIFAVEIAVGQHVAEQHLVLEPGQFSVRRGPVAAGLRAEGGGVAQGVGVREDRRHVGLANDLGAGRQSGRANGFGRRCRRGSK
jgi:hypothetical protein